MGAAADEVLVSPYVTAEVTHKADFAKARLLQSQETTTKL